MPERYSTQKSYTSILKRHLLPQWENSPVAEVKKPFKVEQWLKERQAVSEQKRNANSAVVGLLFGRGGFVLANGNQQALTAAQLVFIQSHSSDCYCGA
jgi:hypothetical protein